MTTKSTLTKFLRGLGTKRTVFWIALVIDFLAIPILIYSIIYCGKIYPRIFVAGVSVAGLTPEKASNFLSSKINPQEKVTLVYQDQSFDIPAVDVDISYDFVQTSKRAYTLTRTGNLLADIKNRVNLLFAPRSMGLSLNLNDQKLEKIISEISDEISVKPVEPTFKYDKSGVEVVNGLPGTIVDKNLLRSLIGSHFSNLNNNDIEIPTINADSRLSEEELKSYQERLNILFDKVIEINFEYEPFRLQGKTLASFLKPSGGFDEQTIGEEVSEIAQKVDRDPQNPKFNFEAGSVTEFKPAKDGIETKTEELKAKIEDAIENFSPAGDKMASFDVPVKKTPPAITTDKVNNLGIKELIGRGTSRFRGSIPSRVHNISLAAAKLNGILIAPGETFSFNQALGDVSIFTGFQQAYVIREGKTVLGDGGGVCQVSTTLFRAALNAGLPIAERRAHAYRVGYYEQDTSPGYDATVYSPSPDLKIKNDTPGNILIQTETDTKNYSLVFELYGTSDGRVSSVGKPIVSKVIAPPEDLYVDDPTLPAGTIKQTEHKAYGSTVVFSYKVTRGEQTLVNTKFTSIYRPWQAVYLRGTGISI